MINTIINKIKKILKSKILISKFINFCNIPGWLKLSEGIALFYTSKMSLNKGVIIEIGSFAGRSTVFLAHGSIKRENPFIYAVDPFIGNPFEKKIYQKQYKKSTLNLQEQFLINLKKAEVKSNVILIKKSSEKAAKKFKKPVRLLFIDGIHKYSYVKKDYLSWKDKIILEGIIAFHDSNTSDVKRFLNSHIYNSNEYKYLGRVASTTFFQKKYKSSIHNMILNIKLQIIYKLLHLLDFILVLLKIKI